VTHSSLSRRDRLSPSTRHRGQSSLGHARDAGSIGQRGQSIAEFALIVPFLLLIVIAIADLGRLYVSAVAVEAAAREAADYGSFKAEYWTDVNRPTTLDQMRRRACTAASGSHLEGYAEPAGTVDHADCSNPTFSATLEPDSPSCSDPTTEPPCVVHVHLEYDFTMIGAFPPLPETIHFGRDSRFAVSDLVAPTPSP
jgi:Flp pilus assembly protein TadG